MIVKLYNATNSQTGEEITGTAKELGEKFGYSQTTIRDCAKTGCMTKAGWKIRFVKQSFSGEVYVATCPGEDPIVGPFSEISALSGLSETRLRELYRSGKASRDGWRVRKAQPEEWD